MQKANFLSSQEAEVSAKINGHLVDYFANMFSIKIFATHDFERKLLSNNLNEYINRGRVKILF